MERLFASKKRTKLAEEKERAHFDYTLAELIGHSVARIYNKENEYPKIELVYPSIFDTKEMEVERQK